MIRLEHAKKTYPGFQLDCSMEIREGQITALIGANGAGKSTTFKMILGLIRPESGEVAVKKTSPSNTKNAAIGALIAAFLVCAYISLTVILNDTIQSEEDVEKYLELPVLAVIPESKIHGRGEKKVKRTSGIWDIINPFAGKEKNERR